MTKKKIVIRRSATDDSGKKKATTKKKTSKKNVAPRKKKAGLPKPPAGSEPVSQEEADKHKELTLLEERFCYAVMKHGNHAQAYIDAGYKAKTRRNAAICAHEVVNRPHVEEFLRLLREGMRGEQINEIARVHQELRRLSFMDPRKLFNEDGTLKAIHELDDDTAASIAGIEVVQKGLKYINTSENSDGEGATEILAERLHKIKFVDKKSVLETYAKILGMHKDGKEDDGNKDTLKSFLQEIDGESIGPPALRQGNGKQ